MMKHLMNAMVEYFENVPDQLRRRRILVWLLFVAATVFCILGMGRIRFDASIEGWFDKEDPTIVAFDWFHHEFGSDDHLFIVYKPKDGDVFSDQSLKTLSQLQQDLQGRVNRLQANDSSKLTHVVKITSLINAPVLRAEEGALISEKLMGGSLPNTPQELDRIRQIAESQPDFPLLYFSRDYGYGGILIETNFGAIPTDTGEDREKSAVGDAPQEITEFRLDDPTITNGPAKRPHFKPTDLSDYVGLMEEVKTVINKPEYAYHFEYFPVGSTASAEYNLGMVEEMGMLNVAALLIIMALLWTIFRSLSAVVWPVVIVLLSSIWAVGITGWLGLPITSFVMVAIMLTLAVGIADTVHVMAAYLSLRKEGYDHPTALRQCFRNVAVACLLTTITNIVAVVALSITPILPIQIFSFICVLGVGLPFMFSIYLFPLMLDLWAPKPSAAKGSDMLAAFISRLFPDFPVLLGRLLKKVLPVVEKRPKVFIAVFMAVFATCIYGASLTKVNTDPVGSFPRDSKIRESVAVVDHNMMGAQSMEIYLDLGKENAFHDPFVLNAVEQLQHTIEDKHNDVVVRTTSLVDTVKKSYKTLNEDKVDMYVIPATQDAVSQTLFLFNQSNPEDRRKLVSDNYDRSHISVRLYNKGSYEYTEAWESMRADIDKFVEKIRQQYPDSQVSITGIFPLMMQGADYLTENELQSFTASIILVSAMLLVLFGSLKGGIIALVPNLIPAFLSYGALGLLGLPLDITTMMIAPIIIGIAVDDTVHFITHYRGEIVLHGDIRRALEATISHSGQAVVFTTMILGLGFGIMGLSSHTGVANLGKFGALAIIAGMLNDLFLLPALILVFKLKFWSHDTQSAGLLQPEPYQSSSGLNS